MKITVTHDDGTTVDITEGVQVAYDTATGSMDYGSGFLDIEEMGALADLSVACRFADFEVQLQAVQRRKKQDTDDQERRDRAAASQRRRDEEREQTKASWQDPQGLPATHMWVITPSGPWEIVERPK